VGEEITHIGQLTHDPENARKHNPRNIGTIQDALQSVGAARSIVVDEAGVILAGNGVIEAAAAAGIERVKVVDTDGETIVAVRRTGLTPEQKKRLAYFDNRTAELADWDIEQILADRDAGFDLAAVGFDADELAGLLAGEDTDLGTIPERGSIGDVDAFHTCPKCGFAWRKD
jgi:ParB-like chromosome segregation protein Spo0J